MLEKPGVPQAARVLVVEDDAALRTMFLTLLRRVGFDVDCANDGKDAMERLERQSYTVMLLDLMMPVASGFDVLQQLQQKQPAVLRKTIVTTGISARDLEKLDSRIVFAVLRKPFDIERLLNLVSDCAGQTSKRRPRGPKQAGEDDSSDALLDGPARRFESAVGELRALLSSEVSSECESLLRAELRQSVAELGGTFATAALLKPDAPNAERLARLGRLAETMAAAPVRVRQDH